jgi:Leucine-rich repeat (LRR) protein
LPQLRSLEVRDRAPADLRELEGCISLERLEIDGLEPGALDVPINLPRTIRELSLSGIGCFACLDLSSLDALESIDAHDCALGFARMSGGRMEKLRSVSVTSKLSFTLADLTALPNLEELSLVGCRELETLALFAQPSLRKVAISDAPALESIAPLCSPAARIRELELCQLPRLTDLTPLAELPNLEVLELRNVGPRSLGTRSWPSSLREVTLADSQALHEVGALAGAAHLDKLSISACGVDRLPELPDVGEVDASECPHLRDVSALASCRYLHTLSLDGCRSFVDVPSLLTLRTLEDLDLRGTAITNVAPLAALTSLRRLRVPSAVAGQLAALREALPNCRCV